MEPELPPAHLKYKLTWQQMCEIVAKRHFKGQSIGSLSREYGISRSSVAKMCDVYSEEYSYSYIHNEFHQCGGATGMYQKYVNKEPWNE